MVELTKGQKKVARMLINKALLRECEIFLLQTKRMLNNPEEGKNPHENYLQLFDRVHKFDKHIARTYDVLTDEDISLFDEELKDRLIVLKERFNSDK